MTVLMSKPSLNLREELTALRNQGGYSEQRFDMDGLVTNGTFDSDTDWTKGTGWTIAAGVASFSNSSGTEMYQTVTLPAGVYSVSVDVSGSGCTAYFNSPSISSSQVLASGSNTFNLTHNGSFTRLSFLGGGGSSFSISSVSLFLTDGANVIHTTPAGWLPKDVFIDGLLKREGSGWDYTVHTDGTKHWIKPAVAPSATTTTTILGVRA